MLRHAKKARSTTTVLCTCFPKIVIMGRTGGRTLCAGSSAIDALAQGVHRKLGKKKPLNLTKKRVDLDSRLATKKRGLFG